MSKTLLIIQREFLTRVKKKSFIILTILMPFIMAALVFVPVWLSTIEDDEQKAVAVADKTGKYLPRFKHDATYRFAPEADGPAPPCARSRARTRAYSTAPTRALPWPPVSSSPS